MTFPVPTELAQAAASDGRTAWLERLPATVASLTARWGLDHVDPPFEPGGQTAWVASVTGPDGEPLVLKVLWRHYEAEHEADALVAWDGAGAIRCHERTHVDQETTALLLERCQPGHTLATRPEPEQDVVIANLLPRLWLEPPAGHPFRPLQRMCDAWADEYEERVTANGSAVDPGLARDGIALMRSLPASAPRNVLLCTDLHAGNILQAEREPWLVIDPKPYVGDPAYDPVQHLLNCRGRLATDPLGFVGRVADLLGLDRDRLRLWLFARCVQESLSWPALASVARSVAPA